MPRGGRPSSPPPRMSRHSPSRQSAPPSPVYSAPRSQVPVTAPAGATMLATAAPQQPGFLKQIAATAGGVAVGSAVGHVVGHSFMGGGGESTAPATTEVQAPAQNYQPKPRENACGFELSELLQCVQNQSDLSLCEGFGMALRQCRESKGMYQ